LTFSGLVDTPVVTTIHGFSSEQIVPVYEKYNGRGYYVAISDADRHDRLDYVATIHHGIDFRKFELRRTPEDYLLYFGRIHPDKGTVEAIDAADRVGMRLVIAGIIQDSGYFEELVEPRLDGERVSYIGPIGQDRRGDLLGGAYALLHLVNFDEPFGFSVVEAMACGTPVVARRRGAMPEIVRDGVNGFLVDSVEDAAAAVHAAKTLDRAQVRRSVERRFGVERMVDDYLSLYERVILMHRARQGGSHVAR
jgi:glycosyltransferase involved in cell wall biosynthesis